MHTVSHSPRPLIQQLIIKLLVFCVCVLASFLPTRGLADTVTYTMQTGNFNSFQTQKNTSPPYAGTNNNGSNEILQYANGGSTGNTPGAAAFQNFSTTGTGSGTQRSLQIGDTFTITNFTNTNPSSGGEIAIAFRTTTGSSSYSSAYDNVAAKFSIFSSGGYQAVGTTFNDSGRGSNTDTTLTIKVTSSSTFNATISNSGGSTTYYDLQFSNSPTTSTRIQSFDLYSFGDNNSNSYWKNGALTNTGTVELGAGNGTSTIGGAVADGLLASSASTLSANSLLKSGTGVVTLTAANTYSGTTTISGGTLKVDSVGTTTAGLKNTTSINVSTGGTLLLANSTPATASLDRLNNGASVTLAGGTFNTGGLSEHGGAATGPGVTAGVGALTLSSSSVIDLGAGASVLAFANSSAAGWTGTLSIYNWSGTSAGAGTDELFFGTDTTGLTTAQLAQIKFYSDAGATQVGFGSSVILGDGEVVPVPEPSTWLAGILLVGTVGWRCRSQARRFLA